MKVIILATITADGYIARGPNHLSTEWTTKSDKRLFMQVAKEAGNLIMGSTTFFTTAEKAPTVFTKSIPGRRLMVYTHDASKITRYPEVEAVSEPPAELLTRLEKEGVKAVVVCGGAAIYQQFIETGRVTEAYITIQPRFFGTGVTLFKSELDVSLRLLDSATFSEDGTTLMHYELIKQDG